MDPAVPVGSKEARYIPQRNPYFDNARYLLMVLVVIGHFIDVPGLMAPGAPARAALFLIYFVHMPGMAVISGYFAKGEPIRKAPAKLAVRLLAPYVLFQLVYAIALGKPLGLHEPYYLMWYTVSLFSWHLLLPLVKRIPNAIVWTVAVGVLAGYVPQIGHVLSLSRTLAFFPFFLAGYYLQPKHFDWLAGRRQLAITTLAVLAVVAWAVAPLANPLWLNFADAYGVVGRPEWWAAGGRLWLYGAAVAGCGAFFALIPRRTTWFTTCGARTLYMYLWHGLVVIASRALGTESFSAMWLVLSGATTAVVLGTAPVKWLTRWVVEPEWLLPSPSQPPSKQIDAPN